MEIPLFVIIFVVSSLVLSSAYWAVTKISATLSCPIPATVTDTRTITPGAVNPNGDHIIDCTGLGTITVANGGQIIIEKVVLDNGSLDGDAGVILMVDSLTVELGGVITTSEKGYIVGDDESGGGSAANASGTTGGSGGGHGGAGGEGIQDATNPPETPGTVYGNKETALTLGSAGGNSGDGGAGGIGGGAIKIEALNGTVTVNGVITASGGDGLDTATSSGGGGAGGSVWIEANVIAGSGTISANGGSAEEAGNQGGGGGGGRVIVFCDSSNNFTGTVTANGGATASSQNGAEGTILGPTCRPDEPSILKQFKIDNITEILVDGVTRDTNGDQGTAQLVTDMSDVDSGDDLSLQIELQQLGTSFTDIPNYTQGSTETNPQQCLSPISDCGNVTIIEPRSKEYHWQARIRDDKGGFSNWVSFGGNGESERDLLLVGDPSSIEIVSGNNQTATVGEALNEAMVVKVVDSAGFGVPSVTLHWAITQGGGSLSSSDVVSNSLGIQENTFTIGTSAQQYQVQVQNVGPNELFTHNATPDDISYFVVDAPSIALVDTDFDVDIIAYDQYDNIATGFTGEVSYTPVDPNDLGITLTHNLTPIDTTFISGDLGQQAVSNFRYDFEPETIVIKAESGLAVGYSNSIAVVASIGLCPDPDGLIDTGTTEIWDAATVPGGVFDCRGLDLHIKDSIGADPTTLKIIGEATILADSLTIDLGNTLTGHNGGFAGGLGSSRGSNAPGKNQQGSGAGHGGYNGKDKDDPYGSVREPVTMGSGGGTTRSWTTTYSGSPGGSAIHLDITYGGSAFINNNGSLNADSERVSGCPGAGGSVWIETPLFNGTGVLTSVGGSNSGSCDGASGGRIAVYTSGGDFLTHESAPTDFRSRVYTKGTGSSGAGTIYIDADGVSGGNGNLYVHNNSGTNGESAGVPYDASSPVQKYNKIIVKDYGHVRILGIDSTLVVTDENGLEGDLTKPKIEPEGLIDLPAIFNIDKVTLNILGDISGAEGITIGDGTDPAEMFIYAWTQKRQNTYNPNHDVYNNFNNITIKNSGKFTLVSHDGSGSTNNSTGVEDYGVILNVSGNLDVQVGGSLNADGVGYAKETGPGANTDLDGRGGVHGGFGDSGTNGGSGASNPYLNLKVPYGDTKSHFLLLHHHYLYK